MMIMRMPTRPSEDYDDYDDEDDDDYDNHDQNDDDDQIQPVGILFTTIMLERFDNGDLLISEYGEANDESHHMRER